MAENERNLTNEEKEVLELLKAKAERGVFVLIDTQYGEISVHRTKYHGYCAEHVDENNFTRVTWAQDAVRAFWRVADRVKTELSGGGALCH